MEYLSEVERLSGATDGELREIEILNRELAFADRVGKPDRQAPRVLPDLSRTGLSKLVTKDEIRSLEFSLYPNPANPSTVVSFTTTENSQVSITIVDMLGRIVFKTRRNAQADIRYDVQTDLSRFASGMYVVNVRATSAERVLLGARNETLLVIK